MNTKLNALFLSGSLALSILMTTPAMADEANKRIDFQFSAPVQIPGHVLAPGKYVFQLVDDSDLNLVHVFSEDANGNESLVATLSTIPDYISNTPDKPLIHFEERRAGAPEAIHSWFYPGENTGWEIIYPKEQNLEANANPTPAATPTPAPAPVATAAAPSTTPETQVQQVAQSEPAPEAAPAPAEEQILVVQNEMPAQPPVEGSEISTGAASVLPQTGGNSDLELMTGSALLGGGLAVLFASRRKSIA